VRRPAAVKTSDASRPATESAGLVSRRHRQNRTGFADAKKIHRDVKKLLTE
jgi:hypothetical protein